MAMKTSSGMLDSAPSIDDTLRTIADKMERSVRPEDHALYDAIIVAGMKLMWGNPGTHAMMLDYLRRASDDPRQLPQLVAHGITKMLSIILHERLKDLPEPDRREQAIHDFMGPSAAAAIVFMTQVLQFIHKRMGVPINRDAIDQTTRAVGQGVFELYGITPDMVQRARLSSMEGGRP